MKTLENLKNEVKNEVVAFQVSGGQGRNRRVDFIGFKNIHALISMNSVHLFFSEELNIYLNESGDEQDMEINNDNGTGYINFDNDYDTVRAKMLVDCDEDELEMINTSGDYLPIEVSRYIEFMLSNEE